MLNLENKIAHTQKLFAGTLSVMMMLVVCTGSVQAKSHKKIASTGTSSSSDKSSVNGAITKDERRTLKREGFEEKMLGQDLSGGSGVFFVSD